MKKKKSSSVSRKIVNRATEQKLRDSYSLLASIIESPENIVIFALDRNYCYTAFNNNHKQTIKKIWGADIEIGMNMLEIIKDPLDRKKAKRNFDQALKGKSFTMIEEYGEPPNRFYYEDIYSPVFDDDGKVIGLTVFLTDITEKKRNVDELNKYRNQLEDLVKQRTQELEAAKKELELELIERKLTEEALRESEEHYRAVVENSHEGILIVGEDFRFSYVNETLCKMLNRKREEIIGHDFREFLDEESKEFVADRYVRRQKGEDVPSRYEFNIMVRDGKKRRVEISSTLVKDSKGKIKTIAQLLDITERKRAEKEIMHRAEMEMLVANVSSNLVKRSFEEIDTTINEALEKIGAFSAVDRVYVFRLINNGSHMENTHEWCAKGIEPQIENLKNLPVTIFPWWMEKLNHFENIHIPRVADLPLEANAEKEILQAQDIKSLVVVPMIVQGRLYGFIGFDSVKCERTWSEEDVILLRMLGETIAFALEQRQSILKLKESERSFRGIYDHATDAIYIQDREGRFLDVNQGAINMYGYPREFFIGKIPEPLSAPGKNDMKKVAGYIAKAFQGEPQRFEFWGKRKNGEIFPKIVRLTKGVYFGQEVVIAFAMDITERMEAAEALKVSEKKYRDVVENATDLIFMNNIYGNFTFVNTVAEKMTEYSKDELIGMNYADITHPDDIEKTRRLYEEQYKTRSREIKFENRFVTKSGEIRWLWVHSILIIDGDNIVGWQNIGRDITERKQVEEKLKKKMEQLDRANKLMVGRELKMIELKRELNELLEKSGQSKKYRAPDEIQ